MKLKAGCIKSSPKKAKFPCIRLANLINRKWEKGGKERKGRRRKEEKR
jgi:hypothetical protein